MNPKKAVNAKQREGHKSGSLTCILLRPPACWRTGIHAQPLDFLPRLRGAGGFSQNVLCAAGIGRGRISGRGARSGGTGSTLRVVSH